MAIYEYTAIDASNGILRGQLSTWTKRRAARQLTEQRLTVITLKKIRRWSNRLTWFRRGFSSVDRIIFTRSLMTMINAGMSISEALMSSREQSSNPVLHRTISSIEQRIQAGQTLAACLGSYPSLFPPDYVAMIRVGERSGKLTEVFQYLTNKLERDYQLRRKIRNALMYPTLILCFMVGIVTIMMLFVIPRISSVYAEADVALPIYTRILVGTSTFIVGYIWYLLGGFLLIIALYTLGMRRWLRWRRMVHRFWLRLPVVGVIVKKMNIAILSRTISMLLKAGLTIDEALLLTAAAIRNTIYQEALRAAEPFVTRGVRLADIFHGSPDLFPSVFQRMIATGEQTGNLDTMFSNVSQYYQDDVEHWSSNLSSVIEPLLIGLVGIIVGGIAVAILFPLWNFVNVIS